MHPFHSLFSHSRHGRHPGDRAPRDAFAAAGRGFAGFGGRHGPGGDPRAAGFDGLSRGRKLGAADLQLLLLALLAERPSHGYELIKALDERSNGYYSPSPGMVYPALTYLEEIGHASVETAGTKKLYRLTEVGLAHLETQRDHVDALLRQLAFIGQRMQQMREAFGEGANDADTDFDPRQSFRGRGRHPSGGPEMSEARRNLKSALVEKSGAPVAEQRRIAAILERAAAEIRAHVDV